MCKFFGVWDEATEIIPNPTKFVEPFLTCAEKVEQKTDTYFHFGSAASAQLACEMCVEKFV